MADVEQAVLSALAADGEIADSWAFSVAKGIDHQAIIGVQKSLLGDAYTCEENLSCTLWTLTDEGLEFANNGSPEFRVYQSVCAAGGDGMDMTALQEALGEVCKIGLGPFMKNKGLAKNV
jgi:hypothetical protein